MGWIKKRIESEHRKHKKIDWSGIAEIKIKEEIINWLYLDGEIIRHEMELRGIRCYPKEININDRLIKKITEWFK